VLALRRRASVAELAEATGASREHLLGALHRLARQGQLVYDFGAGCHRWRSIMPAPLTDALLGPEHPELTAGRQLVADTSIGREEPLGGGRTHVAGKAGGTSCEAIFDADARFTRAKCSCKYFHKHRLRGGPCRHLIALRIIHQRPTTDVTTTWIH
jgi:hypothetical protein